MTVMLAIGAMLVVVGLVLAVAGRGLHHEPPIITLLTAPGGKGPGGDPEGRLQLRICKER